MAALIMTLKNTEAARILLWVSSVGPNHSRPKARVNLGTIESHIVARENI